ncbi:MAG TPA: circularly permuted type 2 ATP-grasp protein, partial [Bryobacteraceae bacterium]|nr:circularly permuted type 2 ATP-grasp protein [Bryobacteraceae bacterium]
LLTPGLYNETYFEHSYLSRYLGFTLVEGADLTVRDRKVFLKTVHGLQRVDVILRRVDDSFCDPLELRADSYLGVAGLVDAIAAGNVKVANALGSGVIETAAILPFLPGLSRHLLGERLKLPSVATWWCGQDYALDWVLNNLDGVVVKPAFPSRGMEPVFGAELTSAERQSFAGQVSARPYEYVAQEQVALSAAPVWDKGSLHWRNIVLRTYVVNSASGWTAMPGGLVRVSESDGPVVSMQRGGLSKDAWVLWDEPVDTFTMLRPRNEPIQLQRGTADLPSRVGDNLFWLGRYIERAENIARLLRTLMSRVRQAEPSEFNCLLRLYGCLDARDSKLPKKRRPSAMELEQEILSLMGDEARPGSLAGTLSEVARIGGAVRERLSTDFTRLIGELARSIEVEEYMLFAEYSAVLTGCLELLSAVSGMERENITRGPGWLFMSLGRRLERAMYCARQMREITRPMGEEDWPLLEYVLEVADSSITYRTRYYTTLQPIAVVDVLMSDETNPRSLAFQLNHLADLYGKLPRHAPEDLHAIRRAVAFVQGFALETFELPLPGAAAPQGPQDRSGKLSQWLMELESLLPLWSNNVSSQYFSHARTLPITIGE